jgi:hypothetical protein
MLNSNVRYFTQREAPTIIMKPKIECFSQLQVKLEEYTMENRGLPSIAGFLLLLFAAPAFLASGWVSVADITATCGYLALAAPIILQLLCLGKKK